MSGEPLDAAPYRASLAIGCEVEAAVVADHERQVREWRETRGPRAVDPPASPIFTPEVGS